MRRRTRARELSLQFLYALEVRGDEARSDLPAFLKDAKAAVEVRAFVEQMVDGVVEQRAALDARIRELAENWKFDRIARVDRNILRLASWELLYCDEVPARVVLNEAIELGKRYSTAQSGAFVNGILDRLLRSIPGKDAPPPTGEEDRPRRRRQRRGRKSKGDGSREDGGSAPADGSEPRS